MKVAIYVRVSTDEQAKEGYSIPAQQRKLKSFCISQDWEIADLYIDEGKSAKDMNRPDLKRLLQDIEAGKVECVLVYRLDRLTRSVFDLYKLLETFDKYGCKFKSATEVYDTTTAMGRMFITIVAALAQWERENTAERVSFGFAEKARQGKYPLNFRPFGYDLNLEESKLSIRPDEARTVRLIYDLYQKGYGVSRICHHLNSHGIRTRDGNAWNKKPTMEIIKNPLYAGHIRWNGEITENTHEPIIKPDEFEQVQQLIKKRRGTEPRRVASSYIFTGKLKCPNCGYLLAGNRTYATLATGEKVSYKNYRCLQRIHGYCKGTKNLSELKLETAFLDFLSNENLEQYAGEAAATAEKDLNKKEDNVIDQEHLKKELEKIERRKKNWQYAWADEEMSYEDYKKRMAEADKEEKRIKEQLDKVEPVEEEVPVSVDDIKKLLKGIRKNWSVLDDFDKKNLVDQIVEQVHVGYDGKELKIRSIDFI